MLSQLLTKHYGKNTIFIIDEYDVPLDKAFQHGYYDEMVELIRGILGKVLKQMIIYNLQFLRGVFVSRKKAFLPE